MSVLLQYPILPVLKSNEEYWMVQNLRAVNQAVLSLHPIVSNSYIILTQKPEGTTMFTILISKYLFWISLHPESKYVFVFKWTDLSSNMIQQYTWTVLSQFYPSPSGIDFHWVDRTLSITQTEKAQKGIKVLLKEIIPCFDLLRYPQTDNGPSFVWKVTQ